LYSLKLLLHVFKFDTVAVAVAVIVVVASAVARFSRRRRRRVLAVRPHNPQDHTTNKHYHANHKSSNLSVAEVVVLRGAPRGITRGVPRGVLGGVPRGVPRGVLGGGLGGVCRALPIANWSSLL